MKYVKIVSVLALVTAAVVMTFASAAAQDAMWYSGYYTIKGILLHDDSLEVMLEGNADCDRVFRLATEEGNYDVKASALLAAYYSGHEVALYYSGDLASCATSLHRFKVRP